ncbi:hypothetical protein WOSG25_020360 [Weissella oryzae SG25]|uniref:Uncharacterized protein n=1 Tax=Weissella oryzae (strain DSM 25784 / JCM 18191 / LMG 30913 / SG25) TaxID=1329250 RepID=A0A069CYU8_WEIOS|nr:hypothetical protein [Weissella oryzae]GAK30241.1 hypothetical protein WOSG25_020360 [Weissella oryzae SG25]
MSFVSKLLVSSSVIACTMGAFGVVADASNVMQTPDTMVYTKANATNLEAIGNYTAIFPDFQYYGIDGISANNTYGQKYTDKSTVLSLRADSRVLEDANATGAVFQAANGQEYGTTTFVNGKIEFSNIPAGQMNGGVVYIITTTDNNTFETPVLALNPLV